MIQQSKVADELRNVVDEAMAEYTHGTPLSSMDEPSLTAEDLHRWANAIDRELADAYERGYTDGALNPAGLQR